ncbi:patatin-like phospholipase family protein [Nocardioides antri]|nr:patatin-like phospholipase family protein [Nocardioides antri]
MTKRGLVIGAGGVTGLAWSSGTLAALEEATGWDPRTADVLVGTSQGAFLSGLLASSVATQDLTRWYRRELPETHPLRSRAARRAEASGRRGLPLPASPTLLARAVGPRRIMPLAALSGLLPVGTGSLDAFLAPLAAVVGDDVWVPHPATWVTALDYDSGRRICFGAPGWPQPPFLDAVRASCTVPGQFPPVVIDGRRYVDGGAHSTTNADVVADAGLDEVVVLAPMAGEDGLLRRVAQRQLRAEARRLERAGTTVRVLMPTREDRVLMDARPLDMTARSAIFENVLARGWTG